MLVMEKEWDYLIILDACRYDYFKKVYKDYLKGNLRKTISPGTYTLEWFLKNFKESYKNLIYISGNPYINFKTYGKKFFKIIDVWNWGWNERLGTVHPKVINEAVLKTKGRHPTKRLIVHYMQPHVPYLSLGPLVMPQNYLLRKQKPTSIFDRYRNAADNMIGRWLRLGVKWKIKEILRLPPAAEMEVVLRKLGKERLREEYEKNLRIVLIYVSELSEKLEGIIVISSDHGERLGENGRYWHGKGPFGLRDKYVLEVPWFEVTRARTDRI